MRIIPPIITIASAAAAVLAGLVLPADGVRSGEARAEESAHDFWLNEQRRRTEVRAVAPIRQAPAERAPKDTRPAQPIVSSLTNQQQLVCVRACDGMERVMALQPTGSATSAFEAMCQRSAGADARLVVRPAADAFMNVMLAGTGIQEGRAAVSTAPPAQCGAPDSGIQQALLWDPTLQRGDIVTLSSGFHVFQGRGAPPHAAADFQPLDRAQSALMRGLQAARR